MANAESAIEHLYGDAAVRDSLADPEAETLLRWAEDQIMRLASETSDEAVFEAQVDALRRLVKGVNRFVGERGQMDTTDRDARLADLLERGQTLGAPPAATASALGETFAGGDDASALQALLGLLTPLEAGDAATTATAEVTTETQTATDAVIPSSAGLASADTDKALFAAPPVTKVDAADATQAEPETPADWNPRPQPTDLWRHVSAFLKPQLHPPAGPFTAPARSEPDDRGDSPADDETQHDWYE